jgi:hypothetical protein
VNSRDVTIAGFVVLLSLAGVLELLARHERVRLPTVAQTLRAVRSRRGGPLLLFVVWFWFGWHFLAR